MRRLLAVSAVPALAAALVALPSLVSAAPAPATPVQEPVATGTGGAVASMDTDASQAGISALKQGGNAIDAAVATASALGVTIPFVAGPGGGGFMVIYLAKTHQVVTIDGRENCPAACTPTMFTDPKTGQPLGYDYASDQPLATGVPSMVATWAQAVSRYGSKSLAADLQPAIGVAQRGFRINADFQQLTESELPELQAYPASRALLLTPAGQPLPVGYLLRNPDLARTYRLLARYGPSYLYDGPLGQAIVQADDHPVVTPGQHGGPAAGHHDHERPARLPGAGAGADARPLPRPRHLQHGAAVEQRLHRRRGAEHPQRVPPVRRAPGDGAVPLPGGVPAGLRRPQRLRRRPPLRAACRWPGLLSPAFAATRRCLIHSQALVSPVAPGHPVPPYQGCQDQAASAQATSAEGMHTNNIVTVDKWGNIVAYTNTINFFGGSGETVPGYGFLLNNEMTDFDFAPPATGHDPNLPAGGKQPRSSMGPVIAFRHGQPVFSVGAAGGSTIITTVLQIILNHVDFGMSLPAALAAPRVSQTNSATSLAEPDFYNSALAKQLTSEFGEQFAEATGPILPLDNYPGDATALAILGGGRDQAIAEPVRLGGGSALVVNPG